jgi:hypothetical protein
MVGKKLYNTPKLIVYGDVREVTQARNEYRATGLEKSNSRRSAAKTLGNSGKKRGQGLNEWSFSTFGHG